MPWNVSGIVEQRKGFLVEWESGEYSRTECCARHGISRQTGYELRRRYGRWGECGLEERSRATHPHPNQTPAALYEQVLELRRAHPRWGPCKLKVR